MKKKIIITIIISFIIFCLISNIVYRYHLNYIDINKSKISSIKKSMISMSNLLKNSDGSFSNRTYSLTNNLLMINNKKYNYGKNLLEDSIMYYSKLLNKVNITGATFVFNNFLYTEGYTLFYDINSDNSDSDDDRYLYCENSGTIRQEMQIVTYKTDKNHLRDTIFLLKSFPR